MKRRLVWHSQPDIVRAFWYCMGFGAHYSIGEQIRIGMVLSSYAVPLKHMGLESAALNAQYNAFHAKQWGQR